MGATERKKQRMRLFVEAYMIDFNSRKAAIVAGYSEKSARTTGVILLNDPYVKMLIKQCQEDMAKEHEALKKRVLSELIKLGFSNIRDFVEQGNEITDISELEPHLSGCVQSIKKTVTSGIVSDKTSVEIKLYSKLDALEKLGRHLGLFEADNSQKKAVINVTLDDE